MNECQSKILCVENIHVWGNFIQKLKIWKFFCCNTGQNGELFFSRDLKMALYVNFTFIDKNYII